LGGNRFTANSTPVPFEEIASPTQAEWGALLARFPNTATRGWALPNEEDNFNQLPSPILWIVSAEALGPRDLLPTAPVAAIAQSLFIVINPEYALPEGWHWLQFVTTNDPLPMSGWQANVPNIDNRGSQATPFYDVAGAAADRGGFFDLATHPLRATPTTGMRMSLLFKRFRMALAGQWGLCGRE
jgi:hypothetical protein